MAYTRKDIKDASIEYCIYKSEVLQSDPSPEVIQELDIRQSILEYFDSLSDREFNDFQPAPWISDIIDSMLKRLNINQNKVETFEMDYKDFRAFSSLGEDPKIAFNRGKLAEKHNDYVGAIDDYTYAIKYNPEFIDAYLRRAQCFIFVNKFDKAIEDLETASDLGANKDLVKSSIGIVYRESGNLQRALEYQNEAVELNPKNAENYLNRAMTKVLMKKTEGALFDFETSLNIQPDFWKAMYPFFTLLMSQNDFNRAITIANQMIQLKPENGVLYYNRGIALLNIGEREKSQNDFLKAEELGIAEASSILKTNFLR